MIVALKALRARIYEGLIFVWRFTVTGKQVASFWPTSRSLARRVVQSHSIKSCQVVVELGSGTGPVTEIIWDRVRELGGSVRFIAFELDPHLCRVLRKRFPGLDLVEGDASRFPEALRARGISHVDHLINCLPNPSLPTDVQDRLHRGIATHLSPNGSMRQLTEVLTRYMPYYRQWFNDVRFEWEPRNFPPTSGVYICRQPRPV